MAEPKISCMLFSRLCPECSLLSQKDSRKQPQPHAAGTLSNTRVIRRSQRAWATVVGTPSREAAMLRNAASCKIQERKKNTQIVRVGFGQNGFFADFYFWATGFFRGFCRRIFSPHFCGKKWPEKSSRKIPGKILQNLYNKNPPTHFCRGAGPKIENFRDGYLADVRGSFGRTSQAKNSGRPLKNLEKKQAFRVRTSMRTRTCRRPSPTLALTEPTGFHTLLAVFRRQQV